jgi:transposase
MFERKNACLLTPQPDSMSQEMLIQPRFNPLKEAAIENMVVDVATRANTKDQGYVQGDQILIELDEVKEKQAWEPPEKPLEFRSRKHYLFEHIKALKTEGLSQRGIAVELRISRHTVKKYLRAQQVPRYTPRPHRPSKLDIYKPYITSRWREGVNKGIELFLEIKERGYSGSWALLAQYLAKYRLENPPKQPDKLGRGRPNGSGKAARQAEGATKKLKPQPMLSAREAAWIMLKMPEDLTEKQQNHLGHLRSFDQEIEAAYQFSQEFKRMVKEREGYKLERWLQEVGGKVAQEQLMELGSFANGIRQDQAAVTFGLSLEYSQGQTEGQVNRLKTLKRAMYGRAKLPLLRARVLHRDAA